MQLLQVVLQQQAATGKAEGQQQVSSGFRVNNWAAAACRQRKIMSRHTASRGSVCLLCNAIQQAVLKIAQFDHMLFGKQHAHTTSRNGPSHRSNPELSHKPSAYLQRCACQHNAPLASQLLECIYRLVAARGLQPVALVTHQHITHACQRLCVLAQRLIAAAAPSRT
jgi:hypothetical protein